MTIVRGPGVVHRRAWHANRLTPIRRAGHTACLFVPTRTASAYILARPINKSNVTGSMFARTQFTNRQPFQRFKF